MTTVDVHLAGCRPEPLGAYLKALGVLRLVGEQADTGARGWWAGDTFVLRSTLAADRLIEFFVDRYEPTPVVSPWNGGSGFKIGTSPAAVAALATIESSSDPRLVGYRATIAAARGIYESAGGLTKAEIVERCRSELPDVAVQWIDATVVVLADDAVFPPLLGTGGNDGRLDFGKAFLDRVADVLCLRTGRGAPDRHRSVEWLHEALFAHESPLVADVVGQFDPGAAGGANSAPVGSADSLVNPWDWVLLIEGAMCFASAAARRLGSSAGRSALPFTVAPAPIGYGTSAEERSRGEVWAPLWDRPASAREVVHLIGEGRVEWQGGQARTGLDAARAIATLGAQRGVSTFLRHGLIERNGLATAAVVLGRHRTGCVAGIPVAAQLDRWLERVRRGNRTPNTVHSGLRIVEQALFEHALHGTPRALQRVLHAVALLEEAVGAASGFRKRSGVPPVFGLVAQEWLPHLDDGSNEFDLARALASGRDADGSSLARLFRPLAVTDCRVDWRDGGQVMPGLSKRPLDEVLASALQHRAVLRVRAARSTDDGQIGIVFAYDRSVPARLSSVAAWLDDTVDETRVAQLLQALLLLDWSPRVDWTWQPDDDVLAPVAYELLAPLFLGGSFELASREVDLRAEPAWARLLAVGRVGDVVDAAVRRLRVCRLHARVLDPSVVAACAPRGARLAAALSVPITRVTASRLLRSAVRSEPSEDLQVR